MDAFKRILVYANDYRKKHYFSIVLVALSVILEIVPYILGYNLITAFIGGWVTYPFAISITLGIFISLSLKSWLYSIGLIASHEVAYDSLMGMRIVFAGKLMKQPMGVIQSKGTGSYKKNLVDDIESIETLIAHMIPEGIPYAVTPFVVSIILFLLDWRLALLALATIPLCIPIIVVMMKIGLKRMGKFYESEEKMNKTIVEYIAGMEVIKIFNRAASSFRKYEESVRNYERYTLDWCKTTWTCGAIYSAVLPCTLLLVLPVGLTFYLQGSLEMNTFIFVIMLTMGLGIPLVKLLGYLSVIPKIIYKIEALEKTFDSKEVYHSGENKVPEKYDIEYKNVTFAYDENEVVRNVSFIAKENSVTAIVGESGSGKSTLAKLLVKFWDIKKGEILIDGINISDMSNENLMDIVSYVAQDTFLFNIPIIENIRIGKPSATDEEVIKAAKLAQCHDFISKLKDGYNSMPGDSGDKLSGGEKQRITIARAILKDSPIIVLDEATSSTDAENEDKIQEALNSLTIGKTLIVIAHRLSTIVEADNIILLDNGELAMNGTHKELLSKSDLYKKLWDAHIRTVEWNMQIDKEGAVQNA